MDFSRVSPRQQRAETTRYFLTAAPNRQYQMRIATPTREFVEFINFPADPKHPRGYGVTCEVRSIPGMKLLKTGCDTLPGTSVRY